MSDKENSKRESLGLSSEHGSEEQKEKPTDSAPVSTISVPDEGSPAVPKKKKKKPVKDGETTGDNAAVGDGVKKKKKKKPIEYDADGNPIIKPKKKKKAPEIGPDGQPIIKKKRRNL